jgi:hypothetical protein
VECDGKYTLCSLHITSGVTIIVKAFVESGFQFLVRYAEFCYPSLQTGSCRLSLRPGVTFFLPDFWFWFWSCSLVLDLGFSS